MLCMMEIIFLCVLEVVGQAEELKQAAAQQVQAQQHSAAGAGAEAELPRNQAQVSGCQKSQWQ